jgi:predicted dehydrogenase
MNTVLVIGYGSIGRRHILNLLKYTNFKILLLSKRKKISKNDFKGISQNILSSRLEISHSLEKSLLLNPKIAFISNETSKHISVGIKLAKKGIDIFIEKPLSNSSNGIKQFEKIIIDKKLISMVGCNFRFFPPFKEIKKLLNKKITGKTYSIQLENSSYLPDWHPYENYEKGYAAKKNLGGGVTLTQIHELDYLCWFFGLPIEVTTIMDKISSLKINVDDISESILKFANSSIAKIHLDFIQKPSYKSCKIIGSKGIISWNSDENEIKFFDSKKQKWNKHKILNNYKLSSKKINQMYVDELIYFLNCVKKRNQPMNNISEARTILNVALSMKKSSNLKKTIKI